MSTTDPCSTSGSGSSSTSTTGSTTGSTFTLDSIPGYTAVHSTVSVLQQYTIENSKRINYIQEKLAAHHALRSHTLSNIINNTHIRTPHRTIYRWYELLYSYSTDGWLTEDSYYNVFFTFFTCARVHQYFSSDVYDQIYSVFFQLCCTMERGHITIV
jgi:hypothetical protein